MWGSDYPPTEGTFPYSQEAIGRDFAGLPEADVYKLWSATPPICTGSARAFHHYV